jgi:hypothetical protein
MATAGSVPLSADAVNGDIAARRFRALSPETFRAEAARSVVEAGGPRPRLRPL